MGVHVSSSWTPPPPPPSSSHPSGSSQCTGPERPVSCMEPGLAICFPYGNVHVSTPTNSYSLCSAAASLGQSLRHPCILSREKSGNQNQSMEMVPRIPQMTVSGLFSANHDSFFFLINFYWCMVALQCCVSFYCITKWISHTHTYMPSVLDFLPIQVTTV